MHLPFPPYSPYLRSAGRGARGPRTYRFFSRDHNAGLGERTALPWTLYSLLDKGDDAPPRTARDDSIRRIQVRKASGCLLARSWRFEPRVPVLSKLFWPVLMLGYNMLKTFKWNISRLLWFRAGIWQCCHAADCFLSWASPHIKKGRFKQKKRVTYLYAPFIMITDRRNSETTYSS